MLTRHLHVNGHYIARLVYEEKEYNIRDLQRMCYEGMC